MLKAQPKQIDYAVLPEHMREGTRNYIEKGFIPGDFLQAVISNNLKEAVFHADGINRKLIVEWVQFFVWHAPHGCHGSEELMHKWSKMGGTNALPF